MNSDYIYLNNAATSFPKPAEVVNTVMEQLNSIPCSHSRSSLERNEKDSFTSCRKALAELFNIDKPERIVFTSGATESINLALKGFDLNGSHIVSSCIEHNSVIRPLKTLERQGKIELTFIGCSSEGRINPEDIQSAVRQNTKAVVINHCSNVSGAVTDLESIGRFISENKGLIFIVDASQSAGTVPIDIKKMNIDLLAFTGHKSLYGLSGTGGLYISESVDLQPLKTGGTGTRSDYLYQPEIMPIYFEAGTPNSLGISALDAGVSFVLNTGLDKISRHKQSCVERMISALQKHNNIILYADISGGNRPSLFSFNIKDMDPSDTAYILENSFKIITRGGLHCAPLIHHEIGSYPAGSVRVSPSYFSSDDETDKFISAVSEICRAA